MAITHWGIVSYKEHVAIVGKEGLPKISKREFWNLERKEKEGILTKQEEL
jgi:hypothetical protein